MLENYLFDFDGTIADSGETGIIAVQKAFVDYGLEKPTAESVRYYMGVPNFYLRKLSSCLILQINVSHPQLIASKFLSYLGKVV